MFVDKLQKRIVLNGRKSTRRRDLEPKDEDAEDDTSRPDSNILAKGSAVAKRGSSS